MSGKIFGNAFVGFVAALRACYCLKNKSISPQKELIVIDLQINFLLFFHQEEQEINLYHAVMFSVDKSESLTRCQI